MEIEKHKMEAEQLTKQQIDEHNRKIDDPQYSQGYYLNRGDVEGLARYRKALINTVFGPVRIFSPENCLFWDRHTNDVKDVNDRPKYFWWVYEKNRGSYHTFYYPRRIHPYSLRYEPPDRTKSARKM